MAKKSGKSKRQQATPSSKRKGAGARKIAAAKGGKRKTAGAKTPKGKARRKQSSNAPRRGTVKTAPRRAAAKAGRGQRSPAAAGARSTAGARRPAAAPAAKRSSAPRRGGTGREETLAQTPAAGRTRKGRTNPMPTRRSTGTAAGAGRSRSPRLERERKILREIEEGVPTPPSSLDMDRVPSAARSGRQHLQDTREDHNETSPVMTGGDVDADWEDAYAVGDEAPGGDNPTPDQDRVDDIGKALGVTYEDNEELKASDKIADRDKHRWELDPASSEDYRDRD